MRIYVSPGYLILREDDLVAVIEKESGARFNNG